MPRMTGIRRLALVAMLLFGVNTASEAAPIIFSGFDAGASAPGANALAAAAAFNLAVPGTSLETFESFVAGQDTNGLAGTDFTLTSTGFNIQGATTCGAALCGENTTPAGSNFAYSNAANAFLTFTFTTPIQAFGAFFGGLQTASNALVFTDGGVQIIPLNPEANGGFSFVGFYDAAGSISAVTVEVPFDLISVDDVRYSAAAVPEPQTVAMLLMGLYGLRVARRRRRSSN